MWVMIHLAWSESKCQRTKTAHGPGYVREQEGWAWWIVLTRGIVPATFSSVLPLDKGHAGLPCSSTGKPFSCKKICLQGFDSLALGNGRNHLSSLWADWEFSSLWPWGSIALPKGLEGEQSRSIPRVCCEAVKAHPDCRNVAARLLSLSVSLFLFHR